MIIVVNVTLYTHTSILNLIMFYVLLAIFKSFKQLYICLYLHIVHQHEEIAFYDVWVKYKKETKKRETNMDYWLTFSSSHWWRQFSY